MTNKWNAFQAAHKGQGLSRGQMSAMYRAQNSRSSSSSSSSYSAPRASQPSRTTSTRNSWNTFQSAHKGQGLSSTQMSAMYKAQNSRSNSSSSSSYSAPRASQPSRTTSTRNSWNAFQREHKGQGLSSTQMSAMYKAQSSSSSSPPKVSQPSRKSPSGNSWNAFQREHKGQGYTRAQMSEMYIQRKQAQTGLSASVADLKLASSKRKTNSWNEFNKLVKGSGIPLAERQELYHTLKRAQRGAPDGPFEHSLPPAYAQYDDWVEEYQAQTQTRQQFAANNLSVEAPREASALSEISCTLIGFVESLWSPERKETSEANPPKQSHIALDSVSFESQPIGKGAFGDVLAATYAGKAVAVKVLAVSGRSRTKAFLSEFSTLYMLKHPNVVSVFGYVQTDSTHMGIVMEFMSGGSLWDQLHGVEVGCDLTMAHKQRITLQMASAIAYLHEEGIAHRDIKSRNFLLHRVEEDAKTTVVKLCDFGFVPLRNQARSSATSSKGPAVFVGTPSYAAPEVFAEKVVDDDLAAWLKCDVYSLAVVLWELFEDEEPYFGQSPVTIKKSVVEGQRPSFEETPAKLQKCITLMWTHEPSQRPSITASVEKLSSAF